MCSKHKTVGEVPHPLSNCEECEKDYFKYLEKNNLI